MCFKIILNTLNCSIARNRLYKVMEEICTYICTYMSIFYLVQEHMATCYTQFVMLTMQCYWKTIIFLHSANVNKHRLSFREIIIIEQ